MTPDQQGMASPPIRINLDWMNEAWDCIEFMEIVEFRVRDRLGKRPQPRTPGLYAFLRPHEEPMRMYIGMSDDLRRRVSEQGHLRRWSTQVIAFVFPEFTSLRVLKVLEDYLLWEASRSLQGVLWDNKRGLCHQGDMPMHLQVLSDELNPQLCHLLSKLEAKMPRFRRTQFSLPTKKTHLIGASSAKVHGFAQQNGSWFWLLKGSRLSSDIPTYNELDQNPDPFRFFSFAYWQGKVAWQRQTIKRPASFVVTEPIRFRSRLEAAQFLFAAENPTETWVPA